MATYPAESFYRGTIRQSIANNTSVPFTLKVSKIPTLTSWLLTVSPNTANEEIIEYSGVDGTALTITVVKRWIKPSAQALTTNGTDYNNVSFQLAHSQNDSIQGDVTHLHIIQDYGNLQAQIDTKLPTAWGVRTWLTANAIMKTNGSWIESADAIEDSTIVGTDKFLYTRAGDIKQGLVSELTNSTSWIVSEYPFAWTASSNQSAYLSLLPQYRWSTALVSIGQSAATTSFPMYAKGTAEQKYTFYFAKVGAPQDLTFRIETDNGSGAPSGTLVNANAVLVTAIASIPNGAYYELSLPASFVNATAGTPIHFVFWQGSQTINGANYIQIGMNAEAPVVFANVESPWANVTASRWVLSTTGTISTYSATVDCVADCQLVSFNVATTWSVTITNVTDGNIVEYSESSVNLWSLLGVYKLRSGKRYTISGTTVAPITNVTVYNAVTNSAHLNWVNGTSASGQLTNIVTRTATITDNAWVYTTYISKALWTNAIKSVVYAMLPSGATAGSLPILKKDWFLWGLSGLVKGSTYYLSDTWNVSITPWTVSKVLWVAISPTTIRIDSAINIS